MSPTDPPSGVPFTAEAAARWRAARTARRWDNRWLVLVPLGLCLVAMIRAGAPVVCSPAQPCVQDWAGDLVAAGLLGEALVLLARPQGQVLVPYALLPVVWYLPEGLPDQVSRWVVLIGQALLAWLLTVVEVGRRRARQQLAEQMGPEVPYPWTAAGEPSPFAAHPLRPTGRRVLGWLLLGTAVLLLGLGLHREAVSDERAAGAELVQGTVRSSDEFGDTTLSYRLPEDQVVRFVDLEVWWDAVPAPGDTLPLLADQDGWARFAGDPYDPTVWLMTATVVGGGGLIALASAAKAVRIRRGFDRPGAPALRVLVRTGDSGASVGPLSGAPLWKLRMHETLGWDDDTWTGEEDEDDEDTVHLEGPVEALLYQGPDGSSAQLLVRSSEADGSPESTWPPVHWWALVCAPEVRPLAHRTAAVEAAAAPTVETAAAAPTVETAAAAPAPVHADRWETPAPLRLAVGPVAALLFGSLVLLRTADGWWSGLLHPLLVGGFGFTGAVAAFGWQAALDRRGLSVVNGLTHRRADWADIEGAEAKKGQVIVRLRSGRELSVGSRPAQWLGLGGYDAEQLAAAITRAADSEADRPATDGAGLLPQRRLFVNRCALTAYLVLTVATFLIARGWL
ncbi:hypothetical protein KCMC57_up40860 [Kitasatospora sp. CMC57]|uniref:PH domain-containing protein n=1 Tax=Kitasatospora sp. CMC57 TaxID=3231513 RepID=A0AB33K2K8_9ACTN